jgi:hypothetical protein
MEKTLNRIPKERHAAGRSALIWLLTALFAWWVLSASARVCPRCLSSARTYADSMSTKTSKIEAFACEACHARWRPPIPPESRGERIGCYYGLPKPETLAFSWPNCYELDLLARAALRGQ